MKRQSYIKPVVTTVEFTVEHGFAGSDTLSPQSFSMMDNRSNKRGSLFSGDERFNDHTDGNGYFSSGSWL